MTWQRATADEFRVANGQTSCVNLLSLAEREGGMAPLSAIGECWRWKFETVPDFDFLATAYAVRYKPNPNGQAGWQYPGSSNYTVDEYAEVVRTSNPDWAEGREILELVGSLKAGLNKDIVLTAVMDNSAGVRLIVDGLHRATALILNSLSTCLLFSLVG